MVQFDKRFGLTKPGDLVVNTSDRNVVTLWAVAEPLGVFENINARMAPQTIGLISAVVPKPKADCVWVFVVMKDGSGWLVLSWTSPNNIQVLNA